VWESSIDGRPLKFHLAGINNQNFIMQDEETGSWWQQVSGEAILGPLKGRKLRLLAHDELTFDLWKQANPGGRVLRPNQEIAAAKQYASADWDVRMNRAPVVIARTPDDPLEPRAIVIGVKINGESRAYPLTSLQEHRLVIDVLGGTPIMIVMGSDGKSLRGYSRLVGQETTEFFSKPGADPLRLVDSQTGSEWDFWGKAVAGPLTGQQLEKVYLLKDYWFDWKIYNAGTSVYSGG
jgi:hypothetical protein